jgi:tRNA nucleotidyltransferase/poly(A) polymerase
MTTPAPRATVAEAIRTFAPLAREHVDLSPAYLVSGAIRDALLGRPVTELDITNAAREAWAAAINTHLVQLGDRFPLYHLPLRDGLIDLTPLTGTNTSPSATSPPPIKPQRSTGPSPPTHRPRARPDHALKERIVIN